MTYNEQDKQIERFLVALVMAAVTMPLYGVAISIVGIIGIVPCLVITALFVMAGIGMVDSTY